ncbi:MAG TPA: tyrosine-type recombinase/integrase [Acidimicrobiales bacterium]|nr:tyrosine-type recombinase/integrase [Acidimicrobiales bacterium]
MRGTLRKRGDTWSYQLKHQDATRPSGRRYESKGGFRTKKEATEALNQALAAHDPANPIEPSRQSFAAYVNTEWLPGLHGVKPSTRSNYRLLLDAYILPSLGSVALRDVTARHLEGLYTRLRNDGRTRGQGGLSESSVHKVHVAISKILGDAAESGLIRSNPATKVTRRIKPKAGSSPEMKVWTREELGRFLASIEGNRLQPLLGFAVATFLRRGEICGLRWEDVDLDRGTLAVRRARVACAGHIEEGVPKSGRARTVSLDPGTVAALRRWRSIQLQERLAWGDAWTDSGYLFTREDGHPLNPQTLAGEYRRLVRQSGVPVIRFHDLRHTGATLALADGVPVKVVSERLGHASIQITYDVYAHVIPGMQQEAAVRIGGLVWGVAQ